MFTGGGCASGGGVGCGERFFYYFWEVKRKGKDIVCVV